MKKTLIATIALMLTLSSCTKDPGVFTGNIYWKYNDFVGNKPDAGSEIKLYSLKNKKLFSETTADVSGNFKLEDVPAGNYFAIIKSKNTTKSEKEHLDNLSIYSEDLNFLFGFDLKTLKKETNEIDKLNDTYLGILTDSDEKKYGGLSNKVKKYEEIEHEIRMKSLKLISNLPSDFKSKLGLYSSSGNSYKFLSIEIKEGKSTVENIDFGTTYN